MDKEKIMEGVKLILESDKRGTAGDSGPNCADV